MVGLKKKRRNIGKEILAGIREIKKFHTGDIVHTCRIRIGFKQTQKPVD